jgi:hypothetical protein
MKTQANEDTPNIPMSYKEFREIADNMTISKWNELVIQWHKNRGKKQIWIGDNTGKLLKFVNIEDVQKELKQNCH